MCRVLTRAPDGGTFSRGLGVVKTFGNETGSFYHLFMAPGMGHCASGPEPNEFDMVAALAAWVEQGRPPEAVLAVHRTNGQQDRSRPLCVYPRTAFYNGRGDTNDADTFSCRALQ